MDLSDEGSTRSLSMGCLFSDRIEASLDGRGGVEGYRLRISLRNRSGCPDRYSVKLNSTLASYRRGYCRRRLLARRPRGILHHGNGPARRWRHAGFAAVVETVGRILEKFKDGTSV